MSEVSVKPAQLLNDAGRVVSLTVRQPASVCRRLHSRATTSCSRCPSTGSAGSTTRTRTGSTASLEDVVAGRP
jgi:hypothetical protein